MTAAVGNQTAATWSSRLVFLLAAVGAAVGPGNIWKFPYVAGINGGGAFVIVYVAAAALVAVPILIAELMIGRRGRQHPVSSMREVALESRRSTRWHMVGGLGVGVAFVILSYISVIVGWAMSYVIPTLSGAFSGIGPDAISARFDETLADPWRMSGWHSLFMVMTVAIVAQGLKAGIERSIKLLMPALFLSLIVLLAYAVVAGDVATAARFLFHPDFGKLNGGMILAAVGQAFFSIGVGMGMMMTYGAYIPKRVSLARSAFVIVGVDTAIAILAGLTVFAVVFANGLDPNEGPGLMFITLPNAFATMPGGGIFGALFFVLLVFAGLTSAIAALEPAVLWAMEAFSWSRRRAAAILGMIGWLLGLGTVLSFNAWETWHPLGTFEHFADKTFFELIDYLAVSILAPVSALLIALFAGWRLKARIAGEEFGLRREFQFRIWRMVLLRWAVPAALIGILVSGL